MNNRYAQIAEEISNLLGRIDRKTAESMAKELASANRIFLTGVGRSGYMMRGFAMRLMHCGLNAYFLGDSSTPNARKNDILFIGSGSGETGSLKAYAEKAKKIELRIFSITTMPDSTIGTMSDICLHLPAPHTKSQNGPGLYLDSTDGRTFRTGIAPVSRWIGYRHNE